MVVAKIGASGDELRTDEVTKIPGIARTSARPSSLSQRQIVVSEIEAARPRRITSARMSGTWSRERGRPRRAGSSHAIALTATTSAGGKTRPPARQVAGIARSG